MRKFLHFFGIHHWGDWLEIRRGMRLSYIKGPVVMYEKVCYICKRRELKAVPQEFAK